MNATEALTKQLQTTDLPSQVGAAEQLARLAEEAQPAMVALVQHCGSADEDLRNWCTAALEEIGAPAVEQIDELALLASSANADVAFWAATLLGRAGALATSATTILSERSQDPTTPEVQKRATWALERIGAA